uniref:Acyltransferase ACT1-8 n=1 Tax=Plectranthus barbatus TaxID=41228 RepID=A0A1B0VRR1_9LAMI|nr:acyltransferase ACT1-8 [Plectranthus barbatus]UPO25018.1 acyltransferase ACT1-8 [synthetic construct]
MKVERISRKFIKPYTPTPQNLKKYKLSLLDKCMGHMDFAVVLFYESKPRNKNELEESLEKVLVDFYPLAGRYTMNDHIVDCSDEGAVFVEAEAPNVELTVDQLVKNMEAQTIHDFLPDQYFPADAPNPLLSIQVTHFPCGGLAIGIVVSHAVFDGFSLGVFLAAWSKATMNPERKIEITPSFDLPSLLPYKDESFGLNFSEIVKAENIVVKRLNFGKEAITRLRSKLSPNQNGKTISRVRVVCAVIVKALMGLERAKTRDFMICQGINMRERTKAPLQKHACGNLAVSSYTRRVAAAEAEELQSLVNLIGDSIEKSIADYADILSSDQDGRHIISTMMKSFMQFAAPDIKAISFTDWSKFGFYQVDFGFGKPVWTGVRPERPIFSAAILMSNREGDGIEAWLHLDKNDMLIFEQDEEIKLLITT